MTDKKNILLIMPYGGVGGMERLAVTFYNFYKKKGYGVKAIKFIKLPDDIVHFNEDELFFSEKDFYQMSKLERLNFYLKAPLRIRKIIRKHQITHSISFGDMANFFSSLSRTREYKVGSIHALKSVEFENKTLLNKAYKYSYKHSYQNLDKLVCISKAIKSDLIENCGYRFPENIDVVYNPHNLPAIQAMSKEQIESKEERQLFKDDIIMFLGRFSYQKASWHLVKSFALIQQKYQKAKLVFVGNGVENVKKELDRLIDKFGLSSKVFFLGSKENPYKYLKKAKVLALTSYYEGTPNVIVESLSLNVPVVTSLCTDGIIEMMSLKPRRIGLDAVHVEGGIITPSFYKGVLGIPDSDDFTEEEEIFADSLISVLQDEKYGQTLMKNKHDLLDKYQIEKVCDSYLNSHVSL
nr:glycosyltransferase [Allomuricauda sp.]